MERACCGESFGSTISFQHPMAFKGGSNKSDCCSNNYVEVYRQLVTHPLVPGIHISADVISLDLEQVYDLRGLQ